MKLDISEVENLCYRAKRGILSLPEQKKLMKLIDKFSGNEAFEKARIYGQAKAMSEINPALGIEYWVDQLNKPVVIEWEEVTYPDFEAVEHTLAPDKGQAGGSNGQESLPLAGKA